MRTEATGADDGRRRNDGAQPRDLIAALTGRSFGEKNVLSRTIYALIGLSGVWVAVRPLFERRAASPQAL